MKTITRCIFIFTLLLFSIRGISQVAINTNGNSANGSAILDVSSTGKGLLIPRMTKAQRDAINSPAIGLLIYQTDYPYGFYYRDLFYGWIRIEDQNSAWDLKGNSNTSTYSNFIGTTDSVDLSFRVNNKVVLRLSSKGQMEIFHAGSSVFIGYNAGELDDLSNNGNVLVGYSAGSSNINGERNVALGFMAMRSNTTGSNNSSVGNNSLSHNISGAYNAAIGDNVLLRNTTGNNNAAVGADALANNTSGNYNTAVGSNSLHNNTTGIDNSSFGYFSSLFNSEGSYNSAFGVKALYSNRTGDNNIAVGYGAGRNITTGSHNIMLGYNNYAPSATGDNQLNIGNLIFSNGVDGEDDNLSSGNVGIGVKNPTAKLEVNGQVKITGGTPAMGKVLLSDAVGLATWGSLSLNQIQDADNDTKIEVEANPDEDKIRFNIGGTEYFVLDTGRIEVKNSGYSVFIGEDAGLNDDHSLNKNTAIGYSCMELNTNGNRNVAVGAYSLNNNTVGILNVGLGYKSLMNCQIGSLNTAVGALALSHNNGNYNSALGYGALLHNETGNYNTAIGFLALDSIVASNNNTAIGYNSLSSLASGNMNVAIGNNAGNNLTAGSSNIFVGNNTDAPITTGSNQLNIGNIIYGKDITLNTAKVGIGTNDPEEELDVNGNFQVKQSGLTYANIESSTDGATLYLRAGASSLAQVTFFDNGSYGAAMGYDNNNNRIFFYHGQNIFMENGNILPASHKNGNLGASGQAWNDIYYDDLHNMGAAAFTDRLVTEELIKYPPKSKRQGAFDEKTDKGLKELDPNSLPPDLKGENDILTDEMTSYNFKANYEQQLQINELKKVIQSQKQQIEELIKEVKEIRKR